MRPMVQSSPGAAAPVDLADLADRYTMHSERKIHAKLAAAKNGEIDDFEAALPLPPVEAAGEFGDNVELF